MHSGIQLATSMNVDTGNIILHTNLLIIILFILYTSVVRAFAYGVMGCWINPSWWTHWAFCRFSQCPTTGVTKAVVCVILSVG